MWPRSIVPKLKEIRTNRTEVGRGGTYQASMEYQKLDSERFSLALSFRISCQWILFSLVSSLVVVRQAHR